MKKALILGGRAVMRIERDVTMIYALPILCKCRIYGYMHKLLYSSSYTVCVTGKTDSLFPISHFLQARGHYSLLIVLK